MHEVGIASEGLSESLETHSSCPVPQYLDWTAIYIYISIYIFIYTPTLFYMNFVEVYPL